MTRSPSRESRRSPPSVPGRPRATRCLVDCRASAMITLDDAPDDVTWTDGGTLKRSAGFLKRTTDMAADDGEHAV
jgi:hypothetical protein